MMLNRKIGVIGIKAIEEFYNYLFRKKISLKNLNYEDFSNIIDEITENGDIWNYDDPVVMYIENASDISDPVISFETGRKDDNKLNKSITVDGFNVYKFNLFKFEDHPQLMDLNIGIINNFDIDLVKNEKLNLNVTRDNFLKDEKWKQFTLSIFKAISQKLYTLFYQNLITQNINKRQEIFDRFLITFDFLDELLNTKDFFDRFFTLKLLYKENTGIYNLSEIKQKFNGKIYLSQFISNLLPYLNYKEDILNLSYALFKKSEIKVLADPNINTTIEFNFNSKSNVIIYDNKYEINFNKYQNYFIFANYDDTIKNFLFCDNELKIFNCNHPLSRLFIKLLKINDIEGIKVRNLLINLFKDIISYVNYYSKENFIERYVNISNKIMGIVQNLEYIEKELRNSVINKNDIFYQTNETGSKNWR